MKLNEKIIPNLIDPFNQRELKYFELNNESKPDAIFIEPMSGSAYPVLSGVPVFLQDAFPPQFIDKYSDQLKQLKQQIPSLIYNSSDHAPEWSFSHEWQAHAGEKMDTTWGMSTQSRVQQFFIETGQTPESVKTKIILDAGCGNGLLTEALSEFASLVIGADYSDSVFDAEKRRTNPKCFFIRCDLRYLPFKQSSIDVIVSNGVIHHTPSTRDTFLKMADKTALNGTCYIWLYSRRGSVLWKTKRYFFDFLRILFCRMPHPIQRTAVDILTNVLLFVYKLAGKQLDKNTLRVDMYDSITPRWRNYHTPEEVSAWYNELGFGLLTLSHWDNRYGFGVNATRYHLKGNPNTVPGEHFIIT